MNPRKKKEGKEYVVLRSRQGGPGRPWAVVSISPPRCEIEWHVTKREAVAEAALRSRFAREGASLVPAKHRAKSRSRFRVVLTQEGRWWIATARGVSSAYSAIAQGRTRESALRHLVEVVALLGGLTGRAVLPQYTVVPVRLGEQDAWEVLRDGSRFEECSAGGLMFPDRRSALESARRLAGLNARHPGIGGLGGVRQAERRKRASRGV